MIQEEWLEPFREQAKADIVDAQVLIKKFNAWLEKRGVVDGDHTMEVKVATAAQLLSGFEDDDVIVLAAVLLCRQLGVEV